MEHERGWDEETMHWRNPHGSPAEKMVILSGDTGAKREAIQWAREIDDN